MASIQQEYSYSVKLNYISGSVSTEIRSEQISQVLIDYDYDTKNMPIIYITAKMDKAIMDNMLLNDHKNYVTLEINKILKNSATQISEVYIKDRFFYFMTQDPNYTRDIEFENSDPSKPVTKSNSYREVVIGLIKVDLLNINKRNLSGIWVGTNLINIIAYYTIQMPTLIEPINDTVFSQLLVPPCTSVVQGLEYLNRMHCFYNTPYRYFVDFNRTYLVSSSGKATLAKGETVESIIIKATDTDTEEGKKQGQIYDATQKVYTISVEASQTSVFTDKITDKSFNHILGVSVSGVQIELPLNINNSSLSTKKVKVERIPNENYNYINHLKKNIEGHAMILQVNKTDIDTSILNINKSYNVKNFKTYSGLDGQFLLSRKREIYQPDGDLFIMDTIIDLRKIMS